MRKTRKSSRVRKKPKTGRNLRKWEKAGKCTRVYSKSPPFEGFWNVTEVRRRRKGGRNGILCTNSPLAFAFWGRIPLQTTKKTGEYRNFSSIPPPFEINALHAPEPDFRFFASGFEGIHMTSRQWLPEGNHAEEKRVVYLRQGFLEALWIN